MKSQPSADSAGELEEQFTELFHGLATNDAIKFGAAIDELLRLGLGNSPLGFAIQTVGNRAFASPPQVEMETFDLVNVFCRFMFDNHIAHRLTVDELKQLLRKLGS